MQFINQANPVLESDSLRAPSGAWKEIAEALGAAWSSGFAGIWAVQVEISVEEVQADLHHGRE